MEEVNKRIDELRQLYKDAYGQELSIEEAREMAHRLIELYKLLMRPLPHEKASPSREPPAQIAP